MKSAVVLLDGSPTAAPRATKGFARYVGRVGALAVALGIGAAVATSPGIAVAVPDNAGSTGPSAGSESTGTQQDSTSDTNAADTAAVDDTPTTATAPTTAPASGSDTGSTPATSPSDPRDGTVQASGGANTTVTTADGTTTTSSPRKVGATRSKAIASASHGNREGCTVRHRQKHSNRLERDADHQPPRPHPTQLNGVRRHGVFDADGRHPHGE